MESSVPQLLPVLKQYFGFTSFRPLQEEIIRDALAGKDVFALLPTGGGKSLCFQLPAMTRSGLTVVVSPLIALMKDQVDALQASGVPATFLNSSLAAEALYPAHQSLAAGYVVAHPGSDNDFLPGLHEVSDVVFIGAAVAGVVAHVGAVDPEPALGVDSADLEPDLLACPRSRQSQLLAVPAGAHV
jgi:superfamily II DNA helicase RecQ